jgi:hypothetical protein
MTENGDGNPTFSSRLKEKRLEKGWWQYYLPARAGRTNSNISYVGKHFIPRPKLDMVEGLAAALGWDINEARRLAGYRNSGDNPIPLEDEAEDDFVLSLIGCKRLSRNSPETVKRRVRRIIDLVSKYGRRTSVEIPEIELDELDDEWKEWEEGE